jgi:peptidyl-dipeptidase Dcp
MGRKQSSSCPTRRLEKVLRILHRLAVMIRNAIVRLFHFGVIFMCILTKTVAAQNNASSNPLLAEWGTPFGVPPFHEVRSEHFEPAIQEAMNRQQAEVAAIAESGQPPSFANTVEALENTGILLDRCIDVFDALANAEQTDELQAIGQRLAPKKAAHHDAILLNRQLFARIKTIWDSRDNLRVAPDQQMLLERIYKRFVRGGALLDEAQQERLRAINSELATMSVVFGDNILNEMNKYRLVVERPEDLAGLPERVVAAAADRAAEAGMKGKWVFTLHYPSIWPFLENADNRELRRQIFSAYTARGDNDEKSGNRTIASRMAGLRAEKARLLGFKTWAGFVLDEQMARTPENVYDLLNRLWEPAKEMARREADALQEAIRADGKTFDLQPWDWFYYAEKVRRARYDLDEDSLRPFFQLEKVLEGAFEVGRKLYGLSFKELPDIKGYHPEVKVYEVKDADGSHLAVFYTDFHPRTGKRPGAWADHFRSTFVHDGKPVRPIIANVCNFSRPSAGKPALLSLEEVETLFHEFGHALHGILSQIRYRSLGPTPRDFVELPSQIMENWALHPEVLKMYGRHHATGETIPAELIEKIQNSKLFNQGFRSVEYLAASLLDMEWHTLPSIAEPETSTLERMALARMGMPSVIVPRYRSTYFQHIFTSGYSAGYYSYIWAEVLDADAFGAFEEKGIFDQSTARSFRVNILEKGRSEEPLDLYKKFRGREPDVDYLLKRRGFLPPSTGAATETAGS